MGRIQNNQSSGSWLTKLGKDEGGPEHLRHHVLWEAVLFLLRVELVDLAGPYPPGPTLALLCISLQDGTRHSSQRAITSTNKTNHSSSF